MKVVSDFFRLWLSLRPAQRVSALNVVLSILILGFMGAISLGTTGMLSEQVFQWVVFSHGMMVGLIAFAFCNRRVIGPILPYAPGRILSWVIGDSFLVWSVVAGVAASSQHLQALGPIDLVRSLLLLPPWGLLGMLVALTCAFAQQIALSRPHLLFSMIVWPIVAGTLVFILLFIHEGPGIFFIVQSVLLLLTSPLSFRNADRHQLEKLLRPVKTETSGMRLRGPKWIHWCMRSPYPLTIPRRDFFQKLALPMGIEFMLIFAAMFVFFSAMGFVMEESLDIPTHALMAAFFSVVTFAGIQLSIARKPSECALPGLMSLTREEWARRYAHYRSQVWLYCCLILAAVQVAIGWWWLGSGMWAGTVTQALSLWFAWLIVLLAWVGLVRVLRYWMAPPIRFQTDLGSVVSRKILKRDWIKLFLATPVVITAFSLGILFLKLHPQLDLFAINGPEVPLFLFLSLLLAVAAWVWSFRLQYRAILERDLV